MWVYVVVAALLYAIYRYRLMFKGFENVDKMFPGLPCYPIVGNALSLYGDAHDVYKIGMKLCNLFRRSFYIWPGPYLVICVIKPHEIEAVLNNTVHIKKAMIYDFLLPWIKRGLLTSFGEKWKKTRKMLTPAFHFGILDGFLDIFNKNGRVFCTVMEKHIGESNFNVMDLVKMCALDNISETAMGVTVNAQMNPSSEYVHSIKKMCYIAFARTIKFWLRLDFIFNLTALGKDQKHALKTLLAFTRTVIEQRIKQRQETGPQEIDASNDAIGRKKKKVFLDVLLDCYDQGQLTIDEVQEEVDTFLFEGHDTITSALSFSLYAMGDNQAIQDRVYKEQFEIFGNDDRDPTMEDLAKMQYLEMVVKESLRLYPSVPIFGRFIEKDLKIDEFVTIPAGSEALILVPGVHQSADIWKNPTVFDPERFTAENSVNRHPYSFIPFSAGPRNCIGMKFAMMEMKSFLSKVLRTFQINPCEPRVELELATEVILQSLTGVPISVAFRNR